MQKKYHFDYSFTSILLGQFYKKWSQNGSQKWCRKDYIFSMNWSTEIAPRDNYSLRNIISLCTKRPLVEIYLCISTWHCIDKRSIPYLNEKYGSTIVVYINFANTNPSIASIPFMMASLYVYIITMANLNMTMMPWQQRYLSSKGSFLWLFCKNSATKFGLSSAPNLFVPWILLITVMDYQV